MICDKINSITLIRRAKAFEEKMSLIKSLDIVI